MIGLFAISSWPTIRMFDVYVKFIGRALFLFVRRTALSSESSLAIIFYSGDVTFLSMLYIEVSNDDASSKAPVLIVAKRIL